MSGENDKNKFRIEDLSESTRKKIFIVAMSVIMIGIFGIWLGNFNVSFKPSEEGQQNFEEIKKQFEELGQAFEESRQTAEELKQQFEVLSASSTPTTTDDLNEKDLEQIKNIILEKTQEGTE